jgi:hypothetical protein
LQPVESLILSSEIYHPNRSEKKKKKLMTKCSDATAAPPPSTSAFLLNNWFLRGLRRPARLQVFHSLACAGIAEAMPVVTASTRECVGQQLQALEAELGIAYAAKHLVALLVLRALRV